MANEALAKKLKGQSRYIEPARSGDEDLGPLKLLPGVWKSVAQGWNMIALPFATEPFPAGFNFRVLMNQYRETLTFSLVDKGVPNRGIDRDGNQTIDTDQFVVTLDYEQVIHQLEVDDAPASDKRGHECAIGDPDKKCLAIHHEPGLWLHMTNETTNGFDIARLGTIPHGNSMLAIGRSKVEDGAPNIPPLNGLPIGVNVDINDPVPPGAPDYLGPYRKFENEPFVGNVVGVPGFPGFFPSDMNAILRFANQNADIVRTTTLEVDSTHEKAGVVNIPFIEREADTSSMKSTFWIQELSSKDKNGDPELRLQYAQAVMLDFFPRRDGLPGLIRWPHISINTLTKDVDAEPVKWGQPTS